MPSVDNTPGIPEFMRAFRGELSARDDVADTHTGSNYDIWGGIAAVLLTRETQRVRDIFRANYFDQARGPELDEIIVERFHNARLADGPGSGTTLLTRVSTAAGAGTFWKGSRIEVAIPNGSTRTYLIAADTAVSATLKTVTLPILSTDIGTNAAIDIEPAGSSVLRLIDPLWDNSWSVQRLICESGTVGETEEAAKSRIRQLRQDTRVGYPKRVIQACKDAGAANVVLFGSDYLDTPPGENPVIGSLSGGYGDVGLNRIFVGDAGFVTSHSLLVKCRRAIASVAVLGTAVQVWGTTPTPFVCSIVAQLWDDPGALDQDSVRSEIRNAVIDYFRNGSNAYYFRYVALQGAIMRSVRSVQTVAFTSGPGEPAFTTFLNTAALPHYFAEPGNVIITLTGP